MLKGSAKNLLLFKQQNGLNIVSWILRRWPDTLIHLSVWKEISRLANVVYLSMEETGTEKAHSSDRAKGASRIETEDAPMILFDLRIWSRAKPSAQLEILTSIEESVRDMRVSGIQPQAVPSVSVFLDALRSIYTESAFEEENLAALRRGILRIISTIATRNEMGNGEAGAGTSEDGTFYRNIVQLLRFLGCRLPSYQLIDVAKLLVSLLRSELGKILKSNRGEAPVSNAARKVSKAAIQSKFALLQILFSEAAEESFWQLLLSQAENLRVLGLELIRQYHSMMDQALVHCGNDRDMLSAVLGSFRRGGEDGLGSSLGSSGDLHGFAASIAESTASRVTESIPQRLLRRQSMVGVTRKARKLDAQYAGHIQYCLEHSEHTIAIHRALLLLMVDTEPTLDAMDVIFKEQELHGLLRSSPCLQSRTAIFRVVIHRLMTIQDPKDQARMMLDLHAAILSHEEGRKLLSSDPWAIAKVGQYLAGLDLSLTMAANDDEMDGDRMTSLLSLKAIIDDEEVGLSERMVAVDEMVSGEEENGDKMMATLNSLLQRSYPAPLWDHICNTILSQAPRCAGHVCARIASRILGGAAETSWELFMHLAYAQRNGKSNDALCMTMADGLECIDEELSSQRLQPLRLGTEGTISWSGATVAAEIWNRLILLCSHATDVLVGDAILGSGGTLRGDLRDRLLRATLRVLAFLPQLARGNACGIDVLPNRHGGANSGGDGSPSERRSSIQSRQSQKSYSYINARICQARRPIFPNMALRVSHLLLRMMELTTSDHSMDKDQICDVLRRFLKSLGILSQSREAALIGRADNLHDMGQYVTMFRIIPRLFAIAGMEGDTDGPCSSLLTDLLAEISVLLRERHAAEFESVLYSKVSETSWGLAPWQE